MDIRISRPLYFSQIGKKDNQEDTLYPAAGEATENTRVLMVCDGMGGHENGEVASQAVASVIGGSTYNIGNIDSNEIKGLFARALGNAYAELDKLDTSDSIRKMGTTLTFLALCNDGVFVAHIGDSRIYQFRPGVGIIFQTRDHSLVNDLVAIGEITEEEAATHPQRNVITRAIMPHQEHPSKAAVKLLTDVQVGDIFMLCCDGVLEKHSNDDLLNIILGDGILEERVEKLRQSCTDLDTRDNNTAYVFEVTATEEAAIEPVAEETVETAVMVNDDETANEINETNSNDNMENSENKEKDPEETSGSNKSNLIVLIVLIAVIVVGSVYLMMGNGSNEDLRNPDAKNAKTASLVEDTTNYDEEVEIKEGLPEEEQNKKKDDEKDAETKDASTAAKTSTSTASTTTTGGSTAAPAGDIAAPSAEAPTVAPTTPAEQPAAPKIEKQAIKSKKIVEDVKEGKSEEATISE